MSEGPNHNGKAQKMSEEEFERGADARRRIKEDLLDKSKTDEEIAQRLHEIEKGKFLSEQEFKELKRTFLDDNEDHLLKRQFMLKKLELEQLLAIKRAKQIGDTELEIELLGLEEKKERMKLEFEISLAKIRDAAKTESEHAKDIADLDITERIYKQKINTARMKSEMAMNENRQKILLELEEEERRLRLKLEAERAQYEHEKENIRLQHEHEFKKITAMIGLSSEEIIALRADPTVLAKALEEKFKYSSKDEIDKLYNMILETKDKALEDKERSIEKIERIIKHLHDVKTSNEKSKSNSSWKLAGIGAFIATAILLSVLFIKSKESTSNIVINNNQVIDAVSFPKASGQADSKKADKGKVSDEKNKHRDVVKYPKPEATKESNKCQEFNRNSTSCLIVQMRTDKSNYHDGDRVTVYVKANKDAYFDLVNTDADGNNTLVLPNKAFKQQIFKGGVEHKIPTQAMGFQMPVDCVTMACGKETLVLTASTTPFMYTDDLKGAHIKGTNFASYDGDVETRSLRLRGIKSISDGTGDEVSRKLATANSRETAVSTVHVNTSK